MTHVSRRRVITGGAALAAGVLVPSTTAEAAAFALASRESTLARYGGRQPRYWGMYAPDVISRLPTSARSANAVCLTFDACGGSRTRYDAVLIATLRKFRVPATLFINRAWTMNNPGTFRTLLADPLFDIENHGWSHRPLSVTGRGVYGIAGTKNLSEVWTEVATAHWYYATQYNYQTRFMRAGTAYTDDVAAAAARYMRQPLVSFSVSIDDGASLSADAVTARMLRLRAGDIGIGHFNHPGSGTATGVARALPTLIDRGVRFKRLRDVL